MIEIILNEGVINGRIFVGKTRDSAFFFNYLLILVRYIEIYEMLDSEFLQYLSFILVKLFE